MIMMKMAMSANLWSLLVLFCCLFIVISGQSEDYRGKDLGTFSGRTQHGVKGRLHLASNKRLYLTEFYYDGEAPDAFVWMGSSDSPSRTGERISADGSKSILGSYSNKVVRIDLPDGKTIADYKWLSIWCRQYSVNFGHISIPSDVVPPVPKSLGPLGFSPRVHNVYAEEVIILNHRQIEFVNLDYDGNGPDAYYWAGTGGTPSQSGFALIDDSNGRTDPIPRGSGFSGKTVTVTIPEGNDIFSIGHVGLWCKAATQDFGHVDIPAADQLNVPPYDDENPVPSEPVGKTYTPPVTKDKCYVLMDDMYQVRWTLDAAGGNLEVSLSARIYPGTWMGFGLSGANTRTVMVGSDVTIAWIDAETGTTPMAVDYYLSAYQQCVVSSGQGVCPDDQTQPNGTNNVVVVDEYFNENGIITVSYTKALNSGDTDTDSVIETDQDYYTVWGIGPINPNGLAAKHRHRTTDAVILNFGAGDYGQCPPFTVGDRENLKKWEIPKAGGKDKTAFQLDIGQAGGVQGYEGIVGQPGWGIAWYVDGVIVPEIELKRNVTYTFTVNGGNDENFQASYHPFYITNDDEGGYTQKTEQEKEGIEIYAGPVSGSLCEYRNVDVVNPDEYDTFVKYRDAALERTCDAPKESVTLTWTPDEDTPDLVYYQCYTHKWLGWKIYVVDEFTNGSLPSTTISMLTFIASVMTAIFLIVM